MKTYGGVDVYMRDTHTYTLNTVIKNVYS